MPKYFFLLIVFGFFAFNSTAFAFTYSRDLNDSQIVFPVNFKVFLENLEEIHNDNYCQFTFGYDGYGALSNIFPSSLNISALIQSLPVGKIYTIQLRCASDDATNEYGLLIHNDYPNLVLEEANWADCDNDTVMCIPVFDIKDNQPQVSLESGRLWIT